MVLVRGTLKDTEVCQKIYLRGYNIVSWSMGGGERTEVSGSLGQRRRRRKREDETLRAECQHTPCLRAERQHAPRILGSFGKGKTPQAEEL